MKRLLNPELYVLTAASALTHFWRLFTPNAVVWDEIYYKRFAGHYFAHTFYFDIHPPLANLLFAGVARIAGVPAATLLSREPVPVLRVLPALCGTMLIPLGYALLRELGASRRVATLAGLALLFENALLVDMRLTFVEPEIICAGVGALTVFLAARRSTGGRRWVLIAVSVFLAGMALSLKWTGASALGIILVVWAFDTWRRRRFSLRVIAEGTLLVAIPAAVYVATFAIHFSLLTHIGEGQAFLSTRFHRTLIGDQLYDSTAHLSFFTKLIDEHQAMRRGNRQLESMGHPAGSRWYTWPIMKHPIAVWVNLNAGAERKQVIVMLGNPVVWWGALIGVIGACLWLLRRPHLVPEQRFAFAFLGGAFALNFVPFIFISRVMFLYHYLFALVIGVLLAAYWVGTIAHWNSDDGALFHFESRRSAVRYWGLVALVVVSFAYFSPLSYGWTISQRGFDNRFWVLHPQL